ncbi:serine hydrolase [Siminovitchia sp. FSL W7-1587]|uniref:serine hydrolase n=1 Tax=Siminovitchia sp. FSL W7-1587 TaxID=2954699 RepID=UPI0030CDD988
MAIKLISVLWDRETRNNINDNFRELFDLGEKVEDEIKRNLPDYIPDGAITTEKTSFIKAGKNLFNQHDTVSGRVSVTGEIIDDGVNVTADYELIKQGQTYITNNPIYTAQYDKDKSFIRFLYVAKGDTLKTENNAVYIRISVNRTLASGLQVEEGNALTPYEPYMKTLVGIDIKDVSEAKTSDAKGKHFTNIKARFEEIERDVADIRPPDSNVVSDEVAEQVFIAEMNKKAARLGCDNPNFKNSSGLSAAGQLTSPKDMTLITRHAAGIAELTKVWGTKNYEVAIKGSSARTINITSSVQDAAFEQSYTILGGKTGTLGVVHNLCLVVQHKQKGHVLAGTILKADGDRWIAMKQLFDEAIKIIENNGSASPTIDAVGACAILLPANPLLHTGTPLNELFLKGNTERQSPASTTKILTSLVLIESVPDLNESFSFKASDKVEDSLVFNEGDRITFKDALYLMMLHSHNTTAKAVARAVGQRIVKARGYA